MNIGELQKFTIGGKRLRAEILNYGATLAHLEFGDGEGAFTSMLLSLNDEDYLKPHPYLGAIAGRNGGRISGGHFFLEGQWHQLSINDGPNHLHGGASGFSHKMWRPLFLSPQSVSLEIFSPDGDDGYPGDLSATVTYTVYHSTLVIDYAAASSRATPVNLISHPYFNLSGGRRDILEHRITLPASHLLEQDHALIPTGRIRKVAGHFDLRSPTVIGEAIEAGRDSGFEGFDHTYISEPWAGPALPILATLEEPESGRTLRIMSSAPSIQFYTGNFLDGTLHGPEGRYTRHFGLCLEPQCFPDAPNQPDFPSTILEPGRLWRSQSIYEFS